jgi:L-arabinonolactonase
MVEIRIECVVDKHARVGEGPVWDDRAHCLWWTDINGRTMHRFNPADGTDKVHELPVRVGCFALRETGGFVLAAEFGFWLWDPQTNRLDHLHDVAPPGDDWRMNDGGCDRQGRLVASSMCTDPNRRPIGGCWRLDATHRSEKLMDGLHIGNGIAFSPAGDQFYIADTTVNTVWRAAYDPATGAVGERHEFVHFKNLQGHPDGATVDSEGGYWIAGVGGARLYRFAPDGRLDRSIKVPITKPTRPMFGGPDLDQLYLTSIGIDATEPGAGGVFRIEGLGFTGLPEPRFRG